MGLQPVNGSTIVKITYDSPNPQVAQNVANGIIDNYIGANLDRRYGAASYARTFLEERLQQLKLKLEESEKQSVDYADQNGIILIGGSGGSDGQTLAQTNLAAANSELAKATDERLRNELLWQQVQAAAGIGVPQMLESKSISDLRAKRADLEGTYKDKLSFFKPDYPEMKTLNAQIDEIDREIAAEVNLIRDSIKAQYETSVSQEQALTKQVEGLKTDITDFRNRNIQYTILQREVDTNRSLYDGLLQRYKEIGVAGGVGTNNISVVDRAEAPVAPHTPNLKMNLALSLMLGLLLGAGAAFGREQFDDTFKSPEDLEEALAIPLLGIIPMGRSPEEHLASLEDPRSPATEAYRSLRTALQFSTSAGVPKTLLVTSARAAEGKSTTALTLAKNYAQVGMKVLLVDADLRKPTLHQYLECDASVGLTNCLTSAVVPPNIFQKTKIPGLTFMPSGPLPPNPAELLAGPKMLTVLSAAADQFDLVIVDGPPVAGLADAPLLSSVTLGTLFVIDGMRTRRNVAKAALKRLHFARAQVVGAVINKLNAAGSAYGYGYGYGDTSYYGHEQPKELTDKHGKGASTGGIAASTGKG
jgi:capsular exopolysaccharide synthesis family protein